MKGVKLAKGKGGGRNGGRERARGVNERGKSRWKKKKKSPEG